jgi:hypothetical protein
MAIDGFSLKRPANAQPIFSSSSVQYHALGTIAEDNFGRIFRYGRAGAVALVAGNCLQAAAQITEHQNMTPSAAAVDDRSISVTPGAVSGAADLYAGGMAIIDTTPGLGYSYPVKTHLAITASTAFVIQIAPGAQIQVALTTSSRVTLVANPWKNVIQSPVTTLTNAVVGVCTYPLAINEYGWIGRNGLFGTLMNSGTAAAVGTQVGCPSAAAGAATGISGVIQSVGVIMDTLANGLVQGVDWHL